MREKRKQRSKLNNPTYKAKLEKLRSKDKRKEKANKGLNNNVVDSKMAVQSIIKNKKFNKLNNEKNVKKSNGATSGTEPVEHEFMGEESKPGTNIRMRSIKKIREQAKEHLQSVRNEKKRLKKQRSRKSFKRNSK